MMERFRLQSVRHIKKKAKGGAFAGKSNRAGGSTSAYLVRSIRSADVEVPIPKPVSCTSVLLYALRN